MNLRSLHGLLLVSVCACAASAGEVSAPCHVGADCISGVCEASGVCAPKAAASGTTTTGAATTGTASGGGAGGHGHGGSTATSTGSAGGQGGAVGCLPNGDGTISRAEVPLSAGLHATFRTAESVPVDTAGKTQPDGSRIWDLTGMLSGDHAQLLETLAPDAQWFGPDFAGATYASHLSDTSDLLGVFQETPDALLLLGVASPTKSATYTELTYNPPVTVLSFPLQAAKTWSTSAVVTGFASGIYSTYTEAYTSAVDAHGTLKTPYATFPVLRVATNLVRTLGAFVTTGRTFSFTTDCFGAVATITSQNNEAMSEFTTAAEVNRLSP